MSKEVNIDIVSFRKSRWERFREWRQARELRFANWRRDVIGVLRQRGWVEAQAEVVTCRPIRRYFYQSRDGSVPLSGCAVTFKYAVDGKSYDGIVVSPDPVENGDHFAIRYNPANPKQNNSFESESSWFDGAVMWTYDAVLLLFVLGLVVAGIRLRH